MPNPYAKIFAEPGTIGFSSAAFLGRMPIAMAPIGIVAMLSQTHSEYWLAGAVSATFALANAFIAPQLSRLIDRYGQTAITVPTALVSALSFLGLMLAANRGWETWTLFAFALAAATMPSLSAMVRARWSHVLAGRPELNTAFAFESAADELLYIAGASLSVGLSVSLFPEAGLAVSTALFVIGALAFVLQRSTEPSPHFDSHAGRRGSAIALRPVQIITLARVFVGAMFATVEVGAVAVTERLGQPSAASLVIGVYAVGSFVLGLVLGALNPSMPLQRQLLLAVLVLALTALPLLLGGSSVPLLASLVFLSGIAISPTFITAFGLIEKRVPETMLTEGVTWVTTGIGIGMALGSFTAGWVVDNHGGENAFWVSVIAGFAAAATIGLGQAALSRTDETSPPPVAAQRA